MRKRDKSLRNSGRKPTGIKQVTLQPVKVDQLLTVDGVEMVIVEVTRKGVTVVPNKNPLDFSVTLFIETKKLYQNPEIKHVFK